MSNISRNDMNPTSDSVFQGYVSEAELARQRDVSVRTCQRDRALRQAPPHVIIGRQIYYRVEAVREWMLAQERRPTRSNAKRRPRFL